MTSERSLSNLLGCCVWWTSEEIPYLWRVTTQIWVVLAIGWKFASTNHKHCQVLASDTSSVWNFCNSFLRRLFAGKPMVASGIVGCFLRQFLLQSSRQIREYGTRPWKRRKKSTFIKHGSYNFRQTNFKDFSRTNYSQSRIYIISFWSPIG